MTISPVRPALYCLAVALVLTGCKPDPAVHRSEAMDSSPLPVASRVVSPEAGEIHGTVSFTGTAPARVPIDMSMDPACAMAAAPNDSEQYVVKNGKLANVFVSIKAGAPPSSAPAGAPPVVLDQKGCRYVPHVIAVQQGGTVDFRNSDPTMHNIHAMPVTAGDQTIDLSEQPGASDLHTFKQPELMMPIRCNNHPWMNAFLNVAQTPWFAVTGADGSFWLKGLPPGTYTLMAVQEKLGEHDVTVTVPAHGMAKADFVFAAR